MPPAVFVSFVDEMEKIAAGPKIITDYDLPPDIEGVFMPKTKTVHVSGYLPPWRQKLVRRHELTHWLRDKRGKGLGPVTGKGLLHKLRHFREEFAAERSAMRVAKRMGMPFGRRIDNIMSAAIEGGFKNARYLA